MNEPIKSRISDSVIPAVAIIVLLIGSLWGPIAMLVGSTIGLAICVCLFRERPRGRGWITAAVSGSLAAALAAAIAVWLS